VGDLLFYEVPSSRNFNPTLFINIGPVIEKKYELLKLHKSQVHKTRVPYLSILESARSMAIYRGNQARAKYAEGFVAYRVMLPIGAEGMLGRKPRRVGRKSGEGQ